jgi:hypothetical protein
MNLSMKACDHLFNRLLAVYGTQWTKQWQDLPMQDAKDAWARELGQYAGRLESIAWALDNLPDRAPNAVQFRNLCRAAPVADVPALPLPAANPQRMREELAKLGHVTGAKVQTTTGAMDWSQRILARHAAGAKITPTVLGMAREVDALRVRRTA